MRLVAEIQREKSGFLDFREAVIKCGECRKDYSRRPIINIIPVQIFARRSISFSHGRAIPCAIDRNILPYLPLNFFFKMTFSPMHSAGVVPLQRELPDALLRPKKFKDRMGVEVRKIENFIRATFAFPTSTPPSFSSSSRLSPGCCTPPGRPRRQRRWRR